ncbi:hypothetical protein QBC36DRAFT_364566, partial [Triangularia setosa]
MYNQGSYRCSLTRCRISVSFLYSQACPPNRLVNFFPFPAIFFPSLSYFSSSKGCFFPVASSTSSFIKPTVLSVSLIILFSSYNKKRLFSQLAARTPQRNVANLCHLWAVSLWGMLALSCTRMA